MLFFPCAHTVGKIYGSLGIYPGVGGFRDRGELCQGQDEKFA